MQEFFDKYIEECEFVKKLRPETIRTYKEVFRMFLSIVPEVKYVEEITPELITIFFKRLETRERKVGRNQKKIGIKKSTIRTYGTNLHSFFAWLVTAGHQKTNPIDKLKLPVPVFEDHRALKRTQIEKIIATICIHSVNTLMLRRDLLMVHTLIFCGVRKSELLSLQVSDIDLPKRLLTVRGETSKSKITRCIPIHPTLLMHLHEYLKERKANKKTTQHLFVANRGDRGLTHHGLKHWVNRTGKLSGVKFHVHRFRHTFATNLAHQDIGAVKIQKLMGHTSLNMTSKYLRSMKAEDLSDEVDKLSIENLA